MVSTLGANYVGRGSNSTTVVWESDLIVGKPRDPSHLRVRELWVRVVVSPIITQMCPTPYQIWVPVGQDNKRTCESLFLLKKKGTKISLTHMHAHAHRVDTPPSQPHTLAFPITHIKQVVAPSIF